MKRFARRNRILFDALLIVFVLGGFFPPAVLSASPASAIEPTGPEAMTAPYMESVASPLSRSQAGPGLSSRAEALADSVVSGDDTAPPLDFSISTEEPDATIESGEVAAQPMAVPVTHLSADTLASVPAESTATPAAAPRGPMMFIENVGQFAEGARFYVYGGDRTTWLADDALWVTVMEPSPLPSAYSAYEERRAGPTPSPGDRVRGLEGEGHPRRGVNLKLSFVGANPHPRLEPFNRLDTHVSYFIGDDPAKWQANVPVWGGVRYVDLYPGLDLEVTSEEGRWAWRLVARDVTPSLAPSPSQVQGRTVYGKVILLANLNN